MKKNLKIYQTVYENDIEVKKELTGEHEPYNEEGAWFFLHENRGFVMSIYNFAEELKDGDAEKFNRIFFSKCIEKKTNLLVMPKSKRANKALDRAEIAELMGFKGTTAVTKCTTLLNKFRTLGIMEKKTEIVKGKEVEQWYVNPLLCKTYYRLSLDLYEMFQDSIDIMMANQQRLLTALKEDLEAKHTPQVTTMTVIEAKSNIKKEQYKDSIIEKAEEMEQELEDMFTGFDIDAANAELVADFYESIKKDYPEAKMHKVPRGLTEEEMHTIHFALINFVASFGEKYGYYDRKATKKEKDGFAKSINNIITFED